MSNKVTWGKQQASRPHSADRFLPFPPLTSFLMPTADGLLCQICGVRLNSVEMYQAHMQGNKHLSRWGQTSHTRGTAFTPGGVSLADMECVCVL